MQFIIGGTQQNLKVTSHVLEPDNDHPDLLNMFHCWSCGQRIMQFTGEVIQSQPGGTFSPLPIIVQCRTCKRLHLFNSIL